MQAEEENLSLLSPASKHGRRGGDGQSCTPPPPPPNRPLSLPALSPSKCGAEAV